MTSTYRIQETALLIRRYGMDNFKKPLVSILPYYVPLSLAALVVGHISPLMALPFTLVSIYFSLVFAAHIHRAYITNQSTEAFNPLQPSKDDLGFIKIYVLLMLIPLGLGFLAGLIGGLIAGKTGAAILTLLSLPFIVFVITRFSLALPDRAVGGQMGFKDSYRISNGLVWKIILAPLAAGWKIILVTFAWSIAAGVITGLVMKEGESLGAQILFFVLHAPVSFGLYFIVTAMAVAGLSNYYLWARQNQGR